MAKILLVEDEHALRELIAFNLQSAGHNVAAVDNANDALMMLEEVVPELILLDIMLPGLKGDQFLKLVRANAAYAAVPVVIISARSSDDDIVAALEAGADDYLTKPFSMKVLLAKVMVMLKRTRRSDDSAAVRYAGIVIDEEKHLVSVDGTEVSLTNKEYELLRLLVKYPRRVFTRNQLLSNVWGYDAEVYSRTVDSHISTLRKKLGPAATLIKSIAKIGYKVE